ncbi:hypothetical protein KKG19_05405 [Patescibacteria group bacterium]|nr:hypothetical protein [Patescibacteria group bacterium]
MGEVDKSVKILAYHYPETFAEIIFGGKEFEVLESLRQVEVNIPQKRVDYVHRMVLEEEEVILHLEFQLIHKREVPENAFLYNAFLRTKFNLPIISVVIYLDPTKKELPTAFKTKIGGKVFNSFTYQVIKAWEYKEDIRRGKYPGLLPLLVMFEEKDKKEEAIRTERELILKEKDKEKIADLLAVSSVIAARYFSKEFLLKFFREEVELMREATIFQDWFLEAEEKGMEKGMEKGTMKAIQEDIRNILEERFGIVKESILNAVYEIKSVPFLRTILRQSVRVKSPEELKDLIAQR